MMKVTEHFTYEELTRTSCGISNDMPGDESPIIMANLRYLCTRLLEPLRVIVDSPIYVQSGYRNALVNKAVKGASMSRHMRGLAADIRAATNFKTLVIWTICKRLMDAGICVRYCELHEGYLPWIHVDVLT